MICQYKNLCIATFFVTLHGETSYRVFAPLDKLGLRSYPQGALIFDEVRIPEKWIGNHYWHSPFS
jgi:alkylation response protein AidB-like acyl-CoA dehydrogenase